MSKDWKLRREELTKSPLIAPKPYNAKRFDELYRQLDYVCDVFNNKDQVKTLTRKIVEETMNIIEHNKSWNEIKVITEVNSTKTRFKCEIFYDGKEYYDPEKNNIGNVIGSLDRFIANERKVTLEDNRVIIRINIEVQ